MIRLQIKDIMGVNGDNLGSVLYANSFFWIEPTIFINITKNIPNNQFWYTQHQHFKHLPVPVLTEKILRTDALGEKIGNDFHDKINGFIPVQASYKQFAFMKDLLLLGKLVFFENGFIYLDTRLNAFMILYEDIQEVNFYQDNSAYI